MLTLIRATNIFLNIIEFLIFIRILLSFLNLGVNNNLGRFVYEITEPILAPSRELIYRLGIDTGMLDLSPIISIFILRIIASSLNKLLLTFLT